MAGQNTDLKASRQNIDLKVSTSSCQRGCDNVEGDIAEALAKDLPECMSPLTFAGENLMRGPNYDDKSDGWTESRAAVAVPVAPFAGDLNSSLQKLAEPALAPGYIEDEMKKPAVCTKGGGKSK